MADPSEVSLIALGARYQIGLRARDGAQEHVARRLSIPALPGPNRFTTIPGGDCFWLGPDEWLVVGEPARRAGDLEAFEGAVGPEEGAAVDLSSSRRILELAGPAAREVLASCCALDLHPRAFGPGRCAQTLLAKAPVLLAQKDETPIYWLFVRPSFVSYVLAWLADGIEAVRAELDRLETS